MDIAAMSMGLSQSRVLQQANVLMMKQAMNVQANTTMAEISDMLGEAMPVQQALPAALLDTRA